MYMDEDDDNMEDDEDDDEDEDKEGPCDFLPRMHHVWLVTCYPVTLVTFNTQ